MKKPITITIDSVLEKKIRKVQSSLISSSYKNWSFSSVTGLLLQEGLKTVSKSGIKHSKK